MKILYIHGYGGHANGTTARMIKKTMSNDDVFAPTYDYWSPIFASRQIDDMIQTYKPDVIVATSLGGLYLLQKDCGIPRIVINPATLEDLEKIDPELAHLNSINNQLNNISDKTSNTVSIFFGTKDVVVTHRDVWVKKFIGKPGFSIRYADMGHEVSEEFVTHDLKDLLNDLKFWIGVCGTEKI